MPARCDVGSADTLVRPEWLFEVSQRLQVLVLDGSESARDGLRSFLADCAPGTAAEHHLARLALAFSHAESPSRTEPDRTEADEIRGRPAPASPRTRFLRASVNKAAAVIGTKYTRPLTLERLAMQVHCNRTDLASSFREHYGHSIHAHLTYRRLDAAKRLLRETEWRVEEIARAVGFRSKVSLYSHFNRLLGCTPEQYRLRWVPTPFPTGNLTGFVLACSRLS